MFFSIFACLPGRPIEKPQKQSKRCLSGIRCCLSLVFHQVFGVKIECESKVTFTVVSQSPKNRKFKKIIFFAYFPGINMSLFPGSLFEKPEKRSKTGLLGIKCCQSLVFCPVFSLKIKYEVKITFTAMWKKPQKVKKSLFLDPVNSAEVKWAKI